MVIFPNNTPTKLGNMNVFLVRAVDTKNHKCMQHALFIKDVRKSVECASGTLENDIGLTVPSNSSESAKRRAHGIKSKFTSKINSKLFAETKLGTALLKNNDPSGIICTVYRIYKGLIKLDKSNAKYNHTHLVKFMRKLRLNYPKEMPINSITPIKQLSLKNNIKNKSFDPEHILCYQSKEIKNLKQQINWMRPRIAKLTTALTGVKATHKVINRQLKQLKEDVK